MNRCIPFVLIAFSALGLAGCLDHSRDVKESVDAAQQDIDAGDRVKAGDELRKALRYRPADAEINLLMARNEEALGDLSAAVPYYLRAAQPDAHLLDAQIRVIELMLQSSQLQSALGRVSLTAGAFPDNADVLALRADVEDRLDQTSLAERDAASALKRNPRSVRAIAINGRLLLKAKRIQEADALVQRGLAIAPDDLSLLQIDAAIKLSLNEPDQAVDVFRAILHAAPGNVAAQRALADVQAANGNVDDATETFRNAVQSDPNNQALQLSFVSFLASHAKKADAVSYLNDLIASHGKEATYDLVLTEFYRQQGELKKGRAVLDAAAARLQGTKAGDEVRVGLAKLDMNAKDFGAAERSVDAVLASDPDNKSAKLVRASIALQNGRSADAINDLLSVVKDDPANGQAFQLLASAYIQTKQFALAVAAMSRSVALSPGDIGAQVGLATFLQGGGLLGQAKELMLRLTTRYPSNAPLWADDARLAIERRDWAAATNALSHLKALPNQGAQSATIDARIHAARGDWDGALRLVTPVLSTAVGNSPAFVGDYVKIVGGAKQYDIGITQLQDKLGGDSTPALKQAIYAGLMSLEAARDDLPSADAAFQKLVAPDPSAVAPYSTYANFLLAGRHYAEARAVLDQGIQAGASRGILVLTRGAVNEASGDLAAALADYREALALNPLSYSAANNYANLLADLSPNDKASLQQARQAVSGLEQSNDPALIDTVAWLDHRLGQDEEAKTLLTRIDAANSQNPQIRFHLGAVLMKLGDRDGALALLEPLKGLDFQGSQELRQLTAT